MLAPTDSMAVCLAGVGRVVAIHFLGVTDSKSITPLHSKRVKNYVAPSGFGCRPRVERGVDGETFIDSMN